MSQMPDKIWLHKDTKYSTADGVFGYQYEFAQEIQEEGIENFVKYVNENNFIDKACKWLGQNKHGLLLTAEDIYDFRQAMEDKL